MKDVNAVLRQKQADLERVREEVRALFKVIPLVAEPGDPKPEVKAS